MSVTKINTLKKKYLPKVIGVGVNTLSLVSPKKSAGVALELFCTPRNGKIESYQKKFLKKFSQLKLEHKGHSLMTYDNGKKGRPVLLCHGWESNSYRWRKLYRELQNTNHRIIMMDAPAHGASGSTTFNALLYADMINVVVDHYKPEVVVGHSVGGYSSLVSQSDNQPQSVQKLIILASPDKLTDITNRYFKMLGYSKRVRTAYDQLIYSDFGAPIESYSSAEYASKIIVPGLIIHDIEDDINIHYEGVAIDKAWKASKLISTTGYGHSLQSQEVYDLILDYLKD